MVRADERTKRLGAYYTPDRVASLLTSWAVDGRLTSVLDPSFGGCAFLVAALNELRRLGANCAEDLVFGVDVDPQARVSAIDVSKRLESQVITSDFFNVRRSSFRHSPFGAVVGNPPYLRYHIFAGTDRQKAVKAASELGVHLSARAASWAYFVIHSCSFLAPGGRLAFLLPGAFLQADYSLPLVAFLESRFRFVEAQVLTERLFTDAQERTVVLLADGYEQGPTKMAVTAIHALGDIVEFRRQVTTSISQVGGATNGLDWVLNKAEQHGTSIRVVDLLGGLQFNRSMGTLGDVARVRLGTVTGANEFFAVNETRRITLECDQDMVYPAVFRKNSIKGLDWAEEDLEGLRLSNHAYGLLNLRNVKTLSSPLAKAIRAAERDKVSRRFKCSLRTPWYGLDDLTPPDAFMSYCFGASPTVCLNKTRATCTNALHRVFWRGISGEFVSIYFQSALLRLLVEVVGRTLGGGAIKIEPGLAVHLPVPTDQPNPQIMKTFHDINRLMREGKKTEAGQLADQLVEKALGIQSSKSDLIREQLCLMIRERRGQLNSGSIARTQENSPRIDG